MAREAASSLAALSWKLYLGFEEEAVNWLHKNAALRSMFRALMAFMGLLAAVTVLVPDMAASLMLAFFATVLILPALSAETAAMEQWERLAQPPELTVFLPQSTWRNVVTFLVGEEGVSGSGSSSSGAITSTAAAASLHSLLHLTLSCTSWRRAVLASTPHSPRQLACRLAVLQHYNRERVAEARLLGACVVGRRLQVVRVLPAPPFSPGAH